MLGRTKGFSLIELLVVIAILSLLMAMLAPSLLRARQAARTVVSSTNLHVIGQTAHLYAADNNNFVPRDAWYGADYGTPGDGSNSPSPGTRAGNTCRSSRSNAWRSGRRSCGHLPAPPLCAHAARRSPFELSDKAHDLPPPMNLSNGRLRGPHRPRQPPF